MAIKQDLQAEKKAGWHPSSHSSNAALRLVNYILSSLYIFSSTLVPTLISSDYWTSQWNGPRVPQPSMSMTQPCPRIQAQWTGSHLPGHPSQKPGVTQDSSLALNPNI